MSNQFKLTNIVAVLGAIWLFGAGHVLGQSAMQEILLNDLAAFREPGQSWQLAGNVSADLNKTNVLNTTKGTGVLVNMPERKKPGTDLYTKFDHGDIDLELDFMMARGSNSGIYLQGRYEIQLEDTWASKTATSANNGGIYERWDESKPEGQKGYSGYAPRQNASKAPGLWQHLKISFQAPRFDETGKKTENAKMLRVELNGVVIHQDIQLLGPTRGAISQDERPVGPLRFQGDHGAVAFRNVKVINYDKPRPELKDLSYTVYKGKYETDPDFSKLPPEAKGTSGTLNSGVSDLTNNFLIRYNGTLKIVEPGVYHFNLSTKGGRGTLKINNQEVKSTTGRWGTRMATLPKGDLPFELVYAKSVQWENPIVGLGISGPGVREFYLGDDDVEAVADPILVNATENTVLRSFVDVKDWGRVVHAVSVGSPHQVHYSYDLDRGTIFQVWRGGFIDATPMWHDRGDGSSLPMGAVQSLTKPVFTIAKLPSPQAAWKTDTAGMGFRTKGYQLDINGIPTFLYQIDNSTVSDAIRVMDNGQGLSRTINIQNPSNDLMVRIAEGKNIEELSKGRYAIDDKSYYLHLADPSARVSIREVNGRKELVMPAGSTISYSVIF